MVAHRIVVVGAGAAGMMAAGTAGSSLSVGAAAEAGANVLVLEKTDRPGKKLLISGKTRCNVTNARDLPRFLEMYGPNGQFLRNAFHRFFRDDLLAFLARCGVTTRAEPDGRIFPASDSARDVVQALERYLADHRVEVRTRARVTGICVAGGRTCGVKTHDGTLPAGAVILATGGASYPGTGSSGDGYSMAQALGHTIVKLRPALVPLVVREADRAKRMQGVSLSNVRLTAYQCPAEAIDPGRAPTTDFGRGLSRRRPPPPVIESRSGDLIFTHNGLGGPATLLVSLAVVDALERGPVSLAIDLKPHLDPQQLRQWLHAEFSRLGRRTYRGLLRELLPPRMVDVFVDLTGIPPEKRAHQVTAEERERLAGRLKSLRFNVAGPLSMAAAIVTAGGVSLAEIDPRTMGSRLVEGLFLCGEVIDLDADTGGYNLQAAFSTGHLAGVSAAACVLGNEGSLPSFEKST